MTSSITDQIIASALKGRPQTKHEIIDTVEPGLSIRIGARGARWSYRSREVGRGRLRLSLGVWPQVNVAQARQLAWRMKEAFGSPAKDEASLTTVGALLDRYEARRLSQLRTGQVMQKALASALAPLHHRQANTILRRDISEIVDTIADRAPIHANRILAYIKAFFRWAVGRGYLEANVAAGLSKPSRENSRARTPSLDELVEIWAAADQMGYPFGLAIQLLMLTAARRDEVGGLRVEELDLPVGGTEGCWTLPGGRSKNERAMRIPLAALSRRILEQALEARCVGGPYVFSTTGRTAVSGWSKAKSRMDEYIQADRRRRGVDTDIIPWRIHDLRRAFATAACDLLQVDPVVADRCLNHVGAATTSTVSRIYGRSELFEPRRAALSKWAELIADAVEGR